MVRTHIPGVNQIVSRGYSILEIVVSIAIFVFLTTILLFGFRGAGYANDFRQSANELVANLRLLQSKALSGAGVSTCDEPPARLCTSSSPGCTCSVKVPAGGYGMHIIPPVPPASFPDKYSLFADLDNNGFFSGNDVVLDQGNVTMLRKTMIGDYLGLDYVFTATRKLRMNGPEVDRAIFCIEHEDIAGIARKVSIIAATGQIQEEATDSCSAI